ncbi:MAG: hypothetical protein ACRCYY_04950 [Trueperaceae bacterium]
MARLHGSKDLKPRVITSPRPKLLESKQVRISARAEELQEIEAWLAQQKSAAQSIAKLLLKQARATAKK